MSKPFQFKEFTVNQDRCAMKVGTDGVLLGAWASLEHQPQRILDVGAGTGLIALQMAQRSNAETLDAVELDDGAYEQCVENFEASVWCDRLFCYHASFQDFVDDLTEGHTQLDEPYDLIVSNPPFYEPPIASPKGQISLLENRKKARFYDALPYKELVQGVASLLSSSGQFATILPHADEGQFISMAKEIGLYPLRITRVRGNPRSKVKRCLLQFGFSSAEPSTNELIIEQARHQYTDDYVALTKAFYIKM